MASVRGRSGDMSITVDARQLERKMSELKRQVPPAMSKAINKRLAAAVKPLVKAQRDEVKSVSTSVASTGAGSATRYNAARKSRRNQGPLTLRQHTSLMGRSGLRESVARTVRVVNRSRGQSHQLTVKSEGSRMPGGQRMLPVHMNKGEWRHPVFPDPSKGRKGWAWVTQKVTPGWFDKPIESHRARIFEQIESAIDDALRSL